MKIAFLVNDLETLLPKQTTAMLLYEAARRGHQVVVLTVNSFSMYPNNQIEALAYPVEPGAETLAAAIAALRHVTPMPMSLGSLDVLMLRTNPARDQAHRWNHEVALMFARMLRERGVLVLNDPDGLTRSANKLYLSYLPAHLRPQTFVSSDPDALRRYIHGLKVPFVLKPLEGTRGQDVFFLEPGQTKNLNQIIDVLTRKGFAMVQDFLPEAVSGHTRVVVLEGEVLEDNGRFAAVQRVPGEGELRSNINAGGHAASATLSDAMREAVREIKPLLLRDGIFLAGFDFIGGKLVELNVFSPGGLGDAERFTGGSFLPPIFDAVERRRHASS